ncbi:DUF5776 domain-containing protein [Levilactobacillus sp. N40-8-2]|uniref:DUF5776 domain-containing protein n=1 Tax=Levilactobacillus muriae TaxID=3238987 RepID=UPI0038B38B70
MKAKLWAIPFLLFSTVLITAVSQPATNVSADTENSSTTTADSSTNQAVFTGNVVTLAPYDTIKLNDFFIGGTAKDQYPLYDATTGKPFDGALGGGDAESGIKRSIDNILINADNGNVYYGIHALTHAENDTFYVQYDSTTMRLNGSTDPVIVTLNFHDSATGKIIQARTIKSGIGASDHLFDPEIAGLSGLSIKIPGYTANPNSTTSEVNTTDNTATINYFYTSDKDTSTPSNPTTGTSTPATTASSASETTSTSGDKVNATTKPVAAKHSAIYATKKIGFYSNPTFSKATRLHWYTKQSRPNRPQFVVTGYARSKAGTLRYHVRAANGKTGYITTKSQYVSNTYYQSQPKSIRVIGKHGINAYTKVTLNGKVVRHYKRGTTLKINRIQKHNLTTRLILSNGTYITGNKTLVIQK